MAKKKVREAVKPKEEVVIKKKKCQLCGKMVDTLREHTIKPGILDCPRIMQLCNDCFGHTS